MTPSATPRPPVLPAGPRHVHISDALRQQIVGRTLRPGDLLPSEAQLCARFEVSRSVVRQALATLEREGLITKAQGRGTVVAHGTLEHHRNVRRAAGLSAQMRALGTRVHTRVLSHSIEPVPASVRGLPDAQALYLERLRLVDRQPIAYIRTWLPLALAPVLSREALHNRSLHDVMQRQPGLRIAGGQRQIRAVAAQPPIAALLGVQTGFPLLLLEGETRDTGGRVVEVFTTWHRSDRIAFDVGVDAEEAEEARKAPAPATVKPTGGPAHAAATDAGGEALERLARAHATAEALARELAALRDTVSAARPKGR